MNCNKKLELPTDLKKMMGNFCNSVLQIIKKKNVKITCIVIQLNKGVIYIGSNSNGRFDAKFYNPNKPSTKNKDLDKFIDSSCDCIYDCWNIIDNQNKSSKMRSFNIFFNGRKKEVYICKNKLGSVGMQKCKIFEEFKMIDV